MRLFLLAVTPLLAFAQDKPASLTGHLADQAGAGISAPVKLDSPPGGVHLAGWSNKDGTFRFSGLPAGIYLFRASPPGFKIFKTIVKIAAGEDKSLPDVELKVGAAGDCAPLPNPEGTEFPIGGLLGAVRGNIQRASSPVANTPITMACDGGCSDSVSGKTDSRGDFSFTSLTPRRYILRIGDGVREFRPVQVVPGFESWLFFDLVTNPLPPEPFVCE